MINMDDEGWAAWQEPWQWEPWESVSLNLKYEGIFSKETCPFKRMKKDKDPIKDGAKEVFETWEDSWGDEEGSRFFFVKITVGRRQ